MPTRPIASWLCALGVMAALPRPGLPGSSRATAGEPPAASRPARSSYKSVIIKGVPHVKQKPDFCGEACGEMWLRKLGAANMDQDYVFDQSGLSPLAARGCYTRELNLALKRIGFKTGATLYRVSAARAGQGMAAQWKAMHADLLAGVPSIVCMHYGDKPSTTEHFRLILGYDGKTDEVIYHEPAVAKGAYRRMKRATLLDRWPLKYKPKEWTVIRMRLEAAKLRKAKPAETFTNADYAQHIMKLKKKIPRGGKFTIVVQPPFVVIGDEPPATVKRRAKHTVKWAVDLFKKDFFKKDPAEILDIWLFKDKASYRKHTRKIFNDRPTTPYGYYSSSAKALIMNIGTGGGTLVHEMVHAFMPANFPKCPAWLNEGLGSLYEQCGAHRGKIWGRTNWRLAGLQKTIRAGKVPSFKKLTSTTTHQFYSEDPGTNYAQARYLCYYLQQRGLLRKFYHAFRANQKTDPTGYETLKKTLGVKDMKAFKKKWQVYVLKLRFP